MPVWVCISVTNLFTFSCRAISDCREVSNRIMSLNAFNAHFNYLTNYYTVLVAQAVVHRQNGRHGNSYCSCTIKPDNSTIFTFFHLLSSLLFPIRVLKITTRCWGQPVSPLVYRFTWPYMFNIPLQLLVCVVSDNRLLLLVASMTFIMTSAKPCYTSPLPSSLAHPPTFATVPDYSAYYSRSTGGFCFRHTLTS